MEHVSFHNIIYMCVLHMQHGREQVDVQYRQTTLDCLLSSGQLSVAMYLLWR